LGPISAVDPSPLYRCHSCAKCYNNAIKQSQFKWLRSRCTQYKTQSFNTILNNSSRIKPRAHLAINCASRKGAEEVFLDSQRWVQAPLV